MRHTLALVVTSLLAFVVGSPLADISPNAQQLMLSSPDRYPPEQCKPEGALCDWPAGTTGHCCAPLLVRATEHAQYAILGLRL
ncbi:hypothetical protein HD554DRAFT_2102688, partial [Boletus coccyginus]